MATRFFKSFGERPQLLFISLMLLSCWIVTKCLAPACPSTLLLAQLPVRSPDIGL